MVTFECEVYIFFDPLREPDFDKNGAFLNAIGCEFRVSKTESKK